MGLQNNQSEADKGIKVFRYIWDEGYHPHKNRDAHHSDINSRGSECRSRNQRPRHNRRTSGSGGCAHSIIPTEAGKLVQLACKATYIQRRGIGLKNGL